MNALSPSPLPPGQNEAISDADFERLGRLAGKLAGLTIPENKRSMVQSRIARRLRKLGRQDVSEYLDLIESNNSREERDAFISVMTTNVSSFLREKHHFDALEQKVLPELLAAAQNGQRVRFWSAGCSSGQEPYTLAMLILRLDPQAASHDIQILATDIDHEILARARAGLYDARDIEIFSDADQQAFFNRPADNDRVEVSEDVKRLVTFRHLNLNGPWPMKGKFDAILCRNVVIYFDGSTQAALWPRFRDLLTPGGWLFLGHSERIANPSALGFRINGVTTYRPENP